MQEIRANIEFYQAAAQIFQVFQIVFLLLAVWMWIRFHIWQILRKRSGWDLKKSLKERDRKERTGWKETGLKKEQDQSKQRRPEPEKSYREWKLQKTQTEKEKEKEGFQIVRRVLLTSVKRGDE